VTEKLPANRPPRKALHGPWRWYRESKIDLQGPGDLPATAPGLGFHDDSPRYRWKDKKLAAIRAGNCGCGMCRYREERGHAPVGIPEDFIWMRHPTRALREAKPGRVPLSYLSEWPLWMFDPFDSQGRNL